MPVAVAVVVEVRSLQRSLIRQINIWLLVALVALVAGRLELQITPCPQRLRPTLAAVAAAQV